MRFVYIFKMDEPNPGGSPFQGFKQCDVQEAAEVKYKFGLVRITGLEELVARVAVLEGKRVMWKVQMEEFEKKWIGRAQGLEGELSEVKKEKEKLREENKCLKKEMIEVKSARKIFSQRIKMLRKNNVNGKNE